jgi:hypothetical protein
MNGFSMNGLSANGFSMNGFSMNGFSMNGFSMNGFSMNGFSMNGLETAGGLSSTSGLMTTPGGREVIRYMVKCAYPEGSSLTKQDNALPPNTYTFDGGLGVAPELEYGTCDLACQERISGCMLAHVNNSGLHVGIWLVGPDNGIGWGYSPNYPYKEAAYFGNLFAANNMTGFYCAGKDMASGNAKGRLGSPFANNTNVLKPIYGEQYETASQSLVPQYCAANCTVTNEGYSQCADTSGAQGHPFWTHPVTVYRNFEASQLYKICNKMSGKCLGVVNGSTADNANVEQRAFSAAAGQTWQILQVAPGTYKIVNKTSGRVLDLNGSQVVQRTYTGAASQHVPLTYLVSEPGFANLKMSTNLGSVFGPENGSSIDGALIKTTTNSTIDYAKWSFIAVSLATFDPGVPYRLVPQHATTMAVEVPYGSTTNGTLAQQYNSWNGDMQKFFVADAGGGNVKLAMKLNKNKCLGPRANGTTAGTFIEVQDCNGSYNQAWISAEKNAAPGTFVLKNAAAPNLCLEVANNSTSPGTRIDLWTCTGATNQQFAAQVAP